MQDQEDLSSHTHSPQSNRVPNCTTLHILEARYTSSVASSSIHLALSSSIPPRPVMTRAVSSVPTVRLPEYRFYLHGLRLSPSSRLATALCASPVQKWTLDASHGYIIVYESRKLQLLPHRSGAITRVQQYVISLWTLRLRVVGSYKEGPVDVRALEYGESMVLESRRSSMSRLASFRHLTTMLLSAPSSVVAV